MTMSQTAFKMEKEITKIVFGCPTYLITFDEGSIKLAQSDLNRQRRFCYSQVKIQFYF